MSEMARMRTVKQCVDYFTSKDPETCIGDYYLRCLVKQNKIPVFHTGRKQLINLDKLIEYLNGEFIEKEAESHDYGKIRRVPE